MRIFLFTFMTTIYLFNGDLGLIMFVLNIYTYAYEIYNYNRECFVIEVILASIIMSLPLSFINIFGGDYSTMPISWFNVFILVGIIYLVFNLLISKNIKISLFSMYLLMFMFIIAIEIMRNIQDINSFFTIIVPLLLLFLLSVYSDLNINHVKLIELYLDVIIASCISLIVQIIFYKFFNIKVGNVNAYSDRIAFSYLFSDFSFMSLFIGTGTSICIYKFINERKLIYLSLLFFTGYCSIITSARTGIVAVIITFFMIVLKNIRIKNMLIYIISIPVVFFLINSSIKLMEKLRGGQALFDSSGRFETYYTAFQIFKDNIMLGIGIGINSYVTYVSQNISDGNLIIPHNFILQSLVQFGVLGFIILALIIFCVIKVSLKFKDKSMFFAFLTSLIGSLFIPDILNSRFFIVQLILILLQYKTVKF